MKREIRILGIDDASFDKFHDRWTTVIATLFRGGQFMDGVMSCKIRVDGIDSTKKLVAVINRSKFKPQIQCILLDGIALGGFNIVDIEVLHEKTGIPVMVVMRALPELDEMTSALKKVGMEEKIKLLEKAGRIHRIGRVYVQLNGLSAEKAAEILRITCTHAEIPEPLRVAHLIGAGLAKGESRGRA